MVTRAFARHLSKNPVPDEDILSALDWIDAMSQDVRYGNNDVNTNQLELVSAEGMHV